MTDQTIRLIPVEAGYMTADEGVLRAGASGDVRFPVSCWVVEHPRGRVIFDTGLHSDLSDDVSRLGVLADVFKVEMAHDLGTAIEHQGVDPARIDFIVFSHLHFDHCGGTAAVPNAAILVQADEWAAGREDAFVSGPAYAASDYNPGHEVREVRGMYDIFGDGTVVCLPTPGHTPGHQSLKVALSSGPVVLGGDCCYWRRMLEDDALPPFGFDLELQRTSMETLRGLERDGARLVFGHDAHQWREIGGQVLT